MNLEKEPEVISDVDRARMEVEMRGPAIRIRVCTEFLAEYQPLSELSCPCPGGLRIGM